MFNTGLSFKAQARLDDMITFADAIRVIIRCLEKFRQFGLHAILLSPNVRVGSVWWTKVRDCSRPHSPVGTRRLDAEDMADIIYAISGN